MLTIASTYTIDPIVSTMRSALGHFLDRNDLNIAPYGQLIQLLLGGTDELAQNADDINLLSIRFSDLLPKHLRTEPQTLNFDFEATFVHLREAVLTALANTHSRYLIILTPDKPEYEALYKKSGSFNSYKTYLNFNDEAPGRVHTYHGNEILALYPTLRVYNPTTDEIAHIPYEQDFYTAMGLFVSRKIIALKRAPYKVIAVDCDNTLWEGICGEQSIQSLVIYSGFKALQKFLIKQYEQGVLICLVSKNNEADVWHVFDQHPNMILKREHIASSMINWEPKSSNLQALSKSLSLGLDSFIFIDDNPVECAEVSAAIPSVLTLQLPTDPEDVERFLQHQWAFDHTTQTIEDKQRTAFYQQNIKRQVTAGSMSLSDFIKQLELDIDIHAIEQSEIARASQLTQRTNQFNTSTMRLSESNLNEKLNDKHNGLVVHLKDRYGDYGDIGLIIYHTEQTSLYIDGFYLSCRALGKGVEHEIISHLGQHALSKDLSTLKLSYRTSERNEPAKRFLDSLPAQILNHQSKDEIIYILNSKDASQIKFRPVEATINEKKPSLKNQKESQNTRPLITPEHFSSVLKYKQYSMDQISTQTIKNPTTINPQEKKLVNILSTLKLIWMDILGVSQVREHDDYLRIGGNSLKAVFIISKIEEVYKIRFSLIEFFKLNTIHHVAQAILNGKQDNQVNTEIISSNFVGLEKLPLSYPQQRLWFIDQLGISRSMYNMAITWELTGELQIPVLKASLRQLLERHLPLRSAFHSQAGQPYQTVYPSYKIEFEIPIQDASELQIDEIYSIVHTFTQEPFNLETPPLLRAKVLKRSKTSNLFMFCIHHIICDGTSFNIMCQELSDIYNDYFNNNTQNNEIEPDQSYFDYVRWQRSEAYSKLLNQKEDSYAHFLEDLPILNLPRDYVPHTDNSYHGDRITFQFTPEVTTKLRKLSGELGITLYSLLCSLFALMMGKYSQQDDIAIATSVSGRQHHAFQNTVGFFINLLIIRMQLDPSLTLEDYLKAGHQTILNTLDFQEVPFDTLVARLQPQRDLSINPLAQVGFVLQNFQLSPLNLAEIEAHRIFSDNDTLLLSDYDHAKFDLTYYCQENGDCIDWLVEYNVGMFKKSSIQNMFQMYRKMIHSVIHDQSQCCSTIAILSNDEKADLLRKSKSIQNNTPSTDLLTPLVDSIQNNKRKIALADNNQKISFNKLDLYTNKLANYLRSLDSLNQHPIICICLPRSIDAILSMIAILKAGYTYLPIDPCFPCQRIEAILEDAKVACVITNASLSEKLSDTFLAAHVTEIISLDAQIELIDASSSKQPMVTRDPNSRAYVMYTSGTTGTPKGIEIPDQSVVRLVKNANYFQPRSNDVFSQIANLAFDGSVFEIWGALLNGNSLYIIDQDTLMDSCKLTYTLIKQKITVSFLPTALFHHFVIKYPECFRSHHYVVVGGEAMNAEVLHKLYATKSMPEHLINGYGPTETTTFACTYEIRQQPELTDIIPIGKPISKTDIYILDQYDNLAPIGTPGEIVIAGDGLAIGYLSNPTLTDERFKHIQSLSGKRVYKTGDIGRWRPDGNIEFLGRADAQVKIRGFRVELSSLEAHLLSIPGISAACAIKTSFNNHDYLVAYVVPENTKSKLNTAIIKTKLRDMLPRYMIPAAIITLDSLPITSTGKVNKRKLPPIDKEWFYSQEVYVGPCNYTQEVLVQLFSECLNIPTNKISIYQDFFDIGGTSLRALELIEHIKSRLFTDLSIKKLFSASNVAELSVLIDGILMNQTSSTATDTEENSPHIVQLAEGSQGQPLYLIHPVGGTVFCYKALAKHFQSNRNIYAIQDPSIEKGEGFFKSVQAIAEYYAKLIRDHQPDGPYAIGGHSFGGMLAVEIADQLIRTGALVNFVGLFDTWVVSTLNKKIADDMKERFMKKNELSITLNEANLKDTEKWLRLNYKRMQQIGFDYVPPKVNTKLTLYKATTLSDEFRMIEDPTNYWSAYSSLPIHVINNSGDHNSLLIEPHVKSLAEGIEKELSVAEKTAKAI